MMRRAVIAAAAVALLAGCATPPAEAQSAPGYGDNDAATRSMLEAAGSTPAQVDWQMGKASDACRLADDLGADVALGEILEGLEGSDAVTHELTAAAAEAGFRAFCPEHAWAIEAPGATWLRS